MVKARPRLLSSCLYVEVVSRLSSIGMYQGLYTFLPESRRQCQRVKYVARQCRRFQCSGEEAVSRLCRGRVGRIRKTSGAADTVSDIMICGYTPYRFYVSTLIRLKYGTGIRNQSSQGNSIRYNDTDTPYPFFVSTLIWSTTLDTSQIRFSGTDTKLRRDTDTYPSFFREGLEVVSWVSRLCCASRGCAKAVSRVSRSREGECWIAVSEYRGMCRGCREQVSRVCGAGVKLVSSWCQFVRGTLVHVMCQIKSVSSAVSSVDVVEVQSGIIAILPLAVG